MTEDNRNVLIGGVVLSIPAGLIIWFLWWLVWGGENPPYYPRLTYETVQSVVIDSINTNSVKTVNQKIFNKDSKIAILSFKSPENTQSGVLISDIFSTQLQKQGFNVVERDNIEQVLNEQNIINVGKTSLSDMEIAHRLGKLVAADYMIFGAVTIYKTEGQRIYLPIHIHKDDRPVYEKEYSIYRNWYLTKFWPFWRNEYKRAKIMRIDHGILSLAEFEEELKKTQIEQFSVV